MLFLCWQNLPRWYSENCPFEFLLVNMTCILSANRNTFLPERRLHGEVTLSPCCPREPWSWHQWSAWSGPRSSDRQTASLLASLGLQKLFQTFWKNSALDDVMLLPEIKRNRSFNCNNLLCLRKWLKSYALKWPVLSSLIYLYITHFKSVADTKESRFNQKVL